MINLSSSRRVKTHPNGLYHDTPHSLMSDLRGTERILVTKALRSTHSGVNDLTVSIGKDEGTYGVALTASWLGMP